MINSCIETLQEKAMYHDQSKLESPEVEVFEEFTDKLAEVTYGSDEYKECLVAMKPAIDHHYSCNPHHPEYHQAGMNDMNLLDLIEMICDWKAAGMRHNDGDMLKSIEINQKRFGYGDELKQIFINTAEHLDGAFIYQKANES